MRSRIADIEPPHEPPTKIAIKNHIAGIGGSDMAAGNSSMLPISGPRPGSAPTKSPIMIPNKVSPIERGFKKSSKPYRKESIGMINSPRNVQTINSTR